MAQTGEVPRGPSWTRPDVEGPRGEHPETQLPRGRRRYPRGRVDIADRRSHLPWGGARRKQRTS
eukprot:865188-Alexandrium_andersonii.AAC.1